MNCPKCNSVLANPTPATCPSCNATLSAAPAQLIAIAPPPPLVYAPQGQTQLSSQQTTMPPRRSLWCWVAAVLAFAVLAAGIGYLVFRSSPPAPAVPTANENAAATVNAIAPALSSAARGGDLLVKATEPLYAADGSFVGFHRPLVTGSDLATLATKAQLDAATAPLAKTTDLATLATKAQLDAATAPLAKTTDLSGLRRVTYRPAASVDLSTVEGRLANIEDRLAAPPQVELKAE